ncbi:twin-arginine translocase subunit TatC [Aestuariimicrobium sp. p3-SID1156]|uniref:twin-arginine translocase subunit TatC n=1 Tax=Aestuariimicrobium sp. p3-SID1156 TaxID=2916038 RepID=UPI0021E420B6|nr:twin-arginine translocase subunit TatC [Aestuariimicrobium sp. p3-SID1156]MCT1459142.1 twin-arginine translocase subunit TatC [Aestuariimicrobium sp. p3-SID1156]
MPDWLKPVKHDNPDGTMALVDHLRELRYRVIWSFIIFLIFLVACLVVEMQYHIFYDVITKPLMQAKHAFESRTGQTVMVTTEGITGAFALRMKIAAIASLIVTCPVWIWHIWAFIMPGLLENEKRYSLRFMLTAVPLFLMGVTVGYLVLPKGFEVMMSFNPPDTTQINEMNKYLTFELQMLLIFGLSFLLPVVLVALNLVGVLRARTLTQFRLPAIFGCFIFGAIATPSTDPFSMLALSAPMAILYMVAEVITHAHDRRLRARGELIELDDEDD